MITSKHDKAFLRKLAEIQGQIYGKKVKLEDWLTKKGNYSDYGVNTDVEEKYEPIKVGDRWDAYDDLTRWFKTTVVIPKEFDGEQVVLDMDFGGEAICRINGKVQSALTSYSTQNRTVRDRVYITDCAKAGDTYEIEIETTLHFMEFNRFRDAGHKSLSYPIRKANLAVVDTVVQDYYFDLNTAYQCLLYLRSPLDDITKSALRLPQEFTLMLESCSKDNFYYKRVKDAMMESITCLDFDFGRETLVESIPKAKKVLVDLIDAIPNNAHHVIKLGGHTHIDTAWLWPLKETVRKCGKTMGNMIDLMDRYPEFIFSFSQPQLYEYVKDYYPELYVKLKEKVKSGNMELLGNSWVEMDTNVPSGETLIRQILYGRQFFMEEFGKCSDILWLPDVFGYSWSLPQIIKRSGMKYFYTSKLGNNEINRFPHSLFRWQGVDGSEITAYLQRRGYNGDLNPEMVGQIYDRFDQKDISENILVTYGFGDGGGGPTFEMLETARRMEDFPGFQKTELAPVSSFFDSTDAIQDKLPVWNDEMYYEFHRGTYTSQANTKKNNRKSELLYRQAEMASALAYQGYGVDYPYASLLEGYKMLLTNQFHDILPGSSIPSVYRDCDKDYAKVKNIGEAALTNGLTTLNDHIKHDENAIIVYNFLSWERHELARIALSELEVSGDSLAVHDADGHAVPCHIAEDVDGTKYLELDATVPSMGYKVYQVSEASAVQDNNILVTKQAMENAYYKIALDDVGNMVSIIDKASNREVLQDHVTPSTLRIFEDKPYRESSWNIDIEYFNKSWLVDDVKSVEVLEANSSKGALRVVRAFNASTITQDIVIYNDSRRIDFVTKVDWYETEKLLKAEFNVDVRSSKATYEIQFGAIERPTHWNTSYDEAKFEVCAHKWADLTEGNFGVSLLNDCKYGYDIKGGKMSITLLKAPVFPDHNADKGVHTFTYSLLPHEGIWQQSDTVQEAYNLNVPLYTTYCKQAVAEGIPSQKSFMTSNKANVIIDTVKCAEDKDGLIVRVYEATGTKTKATFVADVAFAKVMECNLMEEDEHEIETDGKSIDFTIKPFEIKTFRLKA